MSFLAPWGLLLLLAAALVVWLHLRRRFHRSRSVSSLMLYKRIWQEQPPPTPKEPPPFNPLLLLQLLVVLLLALSVARPVWGWLGANPHTLYVLDASMSMQTQEGNQSRFDLALTRVRQDLDANPNGLVSVLWVGPQPRWVVARQSSENARLFLQGLQAGDGLAAWDQALALAEAVVFPSERTRRVLLTDTAGWRGWQAQKAPSGYEAVVLGTAQPNLGFVRAVASLSASKAGLWRIEGHLGNYTDQEGESRIEVYWHSSDGQRNLLSTLEVRLRKGVASFFRTELTPQGVGVAELRLPPDALAADNQAFFRLTPPPAWRVLYLGPGNPALERALQSVQGVELLKASALPPDSDTYGLVVVDRVSLDQAPQTHTLWIGVPPPGVVAGAALPNPDPTAWRSDHPLARFVEWPSLLLARAVGMPRLPGAEVLLEAQESPLVQARTTALGREVVLAFDLLQSNWTLQSGFPVFMANLLRWTTPNANQSYCGIGEGCSLGWAQGRLLYQNSEIKLPQRFVGEGQAFLHRGLEEVFFPERAGVYWLESQGLRWPLAVSAFFPQESDLNLAAVAVPSTAAARQSWPLWQLLLLGALLVLLLETVWGGLREGFLRPYPVGALRNRRRQSVFWHGLAVVLLLFAVIRLPLPWLQSASASVVLAYPAEQYPEAAQPLAQKWLEQTAGAGVVWLGQSPQVGRDSQGQSNPATVEGGPELGPALSLATAMLPPGSAGRVLLLSDGSESRAQVGAALGQAAARGVQMNVAPLGAVPEGEVLLDSLEIPSRFAVGETVALSGVVYSQQAQEAVLRVWRNGQVLSQQTVQLRAGRNRLESIVREAEAGPLKLGLEVLATADPTPQNNLLEQTVLVQSAPKVAVVAQEPQTSQALRQALQVQGFEPIALSPAEVPSTLEGWANYSVAFLLNLPTSQLPSTKQRVLQNWVRQRGGALVIAGGENSFGPGGYYQTTLESLSPLSSKVPREAPKVAMLFVIDKSGSMNQPAGEAKRIDIVKQATVEALKLLHPESLAGVVTFDTQASVSVPLQSVTDREGFAQKLQAVQPSGGTSIYPALVQGFEVLRNAPALARHMVLLTDGLSTPGDFEGAVERIVAAGITLSTVAVGESARIDLMESIARKGGGVAHVATDWQALPSILAQEALLQSKSAVKQGAFAVAWQDRAVRWLEGLPNLPPLAGYVQTTLKPEARLHLKGPDNDPIMASWSYGLGQVVAFASQASGPWTAAWAALPAYAKLWGQLTHGLLSGSGQVGLNLQTQRFGSTVLLEVEAQTPEGLPHTGLALEALLEGQPVTQLWESEPGIYRGHLQASLQAQTVQVRSAQPPLRLQERPLSLVERAPPDPKPVQTVVSADYPARYRFANRDLDYAAGLASALGGQVLLGDEQLSPSQQNRWVWLPVWPLWVVMALVAFLAALVSRYAPRRQTVAKAPQAEAQT